MSYIERAPFAYRVLNSAGLAILLLGIITALLAIYLWLSSRPAPYELYSTATLEVTNEIKVLEDLRRAAPCEWVGKLTERAGRPALRYMLPADAELERQEAECLQGAVPQGYRLEKVTS